MTLPEFHPKGWGYEQWICNTEKYCGKILRFVKGKSCSWHYHKEKHEHFYILEGYLLVWYGESDNIEEARTKMLEAGDVFEVPPYLRHKMEANYGDCVMVEFSTQHFEEDSIRVTKGN